jgi:hypothetical protein
MINKTLSICVALQNPIAILSILYINTLYKFVVFLSWCRYPYCTNL